MYPKAEGGLVKVCFIVTETIGTLLGDLTIAEMTLSINILGANS